MSNAERHNAEHDDSPRFDARRRSDTAVALLITFFLVVGAFVAGVVLLFSSLKKGNREAAIRESQTELDRQISEVRSGRRSRICLRKSAGTDGLLRQLNNMPGIDEVELDSTDITDNGMKSLASLKNLKSLTICDSVVGDRGFSYVKTMSTLERLELTNTRVSDESLSSLKDLPNLRSLTLSTCFGPTFTDAGLIHLRALTKLKELNLSAGLASDTAIKELQAALPNCAIGTKPVRR